MRIKLFIALSLLLSIFAYGYFNYPITDQADRYISRSPPSKEKSYCNERSMVKMMKCIRDRSSKATENDLKIINTVSNFQYYLKNPNFKWVKYSKFDCASIKKEFIDVKNSYSEGDVYELLHNNGMLHTGSLTNSESFSKEEKFKIMSSTASRAWDAALKGKSLSDEIDPINAMTTVNLFEYVRLEFGDLVYQHSFGNIGPCKAN